MTKREALREAKRRWGKTAWVERTKCYPYRKRRPDHRPGCSCAKHGPDCEGGRWFYQVGRIALGMFQEICGRGASWQEAHNNARN